MGCDNSKQEDVQKAQQGARQRPAGAKPAGQAARNPASPSAAGARNPASPGPASGSSSSSSSSSSSGVPRKSTPIGSSATVPDHARDEIMLGTSYTEQRVAENERYFKNLIERTESDLIDISQNIAPLEGQEAIERARDYNESVKRSTVSASACSHFFRLPDPSAAGPAASPSSPAEIEFAQRCGQQVSSTLHGFQVRHIGDLVVQFGDAF